MTDLKKLKRLLKKAERALPSYDVTTWQALLEDDDGLPELVDALLSAAPALIERIERDDRHVTELLQANAKLVEQRRAAEARADKMVAAADEVVDVLATVVHTGGVVMAGVDFARAKALYHGLRLGLGR